MVDRVVVLDHGWIELVDTMGSDRDVVIAARESTDGGLKGDERDRKFVEYLWSHGHHTPFEMVQLKFHVQAPIMVIRQWFRHRTMSYNEYSGRYSKMIDECYVPTPQRLYTAQDPLNRQGSVFKGDYASEVGADDQGPVEMAASIEAEQRSIRRNYEGRVGQGLPNEIARINCPVANYSRFYCSVNLRNFLHFVGLRSDSHAQWEIRQYSDAMYAMIRPLFPWTCAAFENWDMHGVRLSAREIVTLRNLFAFGVPEGTHDTINARHLTPKEWDRFIAKIQPPRNYDEDGDTFDTP